MKKTINYHTLLIWICMGPIFSWSQTPPTLSNPSACQLGLPIDDDTCPEDSPIYQPNVFPIQVSNAPGTQLGIDVFLKEVRILIQHGWLNDLDIMLQSPGGRLITLTSDNGGGENDYGNPNDLSCDSATIFRNNACLSIEEGVPPYLDGPYQTEEHFYAFNDSITNPNGIWQLIICDDVEEDAGSLEFIHLIFEPISCLPVQEIENIFVDSTSAIISTLPEDFCGISILEFGPRGFIPGVDSTAGTNGQVRIINDCPPFRLDGLQELTDFDLYIRRYCPTSGAFSGNTCGNSFTTGCLPPPITIETTFAEEDNCISTCGIPCPMNGLWRNAPNSDFDWIVHSGPSPTQGTGPTSDANGDGKYVYLESSGSGCAIGSEAQLLSACVEFNRAASDTCHFSFNYHMFGSSIGQLRLEVTEDGGFSWQTIWERSGDQGNQWNKEYLSLAEFTDGSLLSFRFVATKGLGFRGDIALDHLVFYGSILQGYPDNQFYVDGDGDDYGTGTDFVLSCLAEAPSGYTDNNLDCNDGDPNINPGRPEIPCNGLDENCSGPADDAFLPSPVSLNDTICSGEIPEICAEAAEGFLTAWYDSPSLENLVFVGPCFSPDLPPNNTPNTMVLTYYAVETNFTCTSAIPTAVEIHIRPQPQLVLLSLPDLCPGETFDLASLNLVDENFTNGNLSYHSASPANNQNLITNTIVTASGDTTFYALMQSSEGCFDELAIPLLISPGPQLDFTPTDSFILCKETITTVAVTVDGDPNDYQYFWNNGKSTQGITIEAGEESGEEKNYAVSVTDSRGCLSVGNVFLQTSNSIDSIFREVTNAISCQGTEGSIAISPLTGLSPYTYEWSGLNGINGSATSGQDTFVINNLAQGSYRITITDSSSEQCAFRLRNVLVQGPGAVVEGINTEQVSCGGAADGSISLDVIGNNPVYNWSNNADTPGIDQLSGGAYAVTITDGPCTTILSDITIFEPDSLGVRANSTDASCAEAEDGQILVNAFGGNGEYNLEWNTGATGAIISNLGAGFYPFTLTDGNNCSLIDSFFLNAPDTLSVQLDSLQNLSCFEAQDGYLQVSGRGGTPPYRYSWDNGSTIPAIFDLPIGTYTVTISDFNGCQVIESFDLQQPEPLIVEIANLIAPLCEGVPNGEIQLGATGGTAPYSFQWKDGAGTQNRENLPAGAYEITVVDSKGCNSAALPIALLPQETIEPGISISLPECVGPATGSISLAPSGVAPFQADWSTGASGLELSSIPAGSYGLSLSDERGCRLDSLITLNAPQVFNVDLSTDPPSCFGVSDGIALVLFTETGTPPFNFDWSDGSTEQDRFTLSAGDYQLTISDALNCSFTTDTIHLPEPEPFKINSFDLGQVNCAGDATAFIEVDIIGGALPYSINWVGQGVQMPGIYEIPSGSYRLQAFDAENCPIDTIFNINEPEPLKLKVDITRGDPCDARQKDALLASATGGAPPYVFNWSNSVVGPQILDAEPGDYTLSVTDAFGCQDVVRSIKVRPKEFALSLDTFFVKDITCFGAADGSMTAKVSGGSGQYSYLFQPARLFENTSEDSITVGDLGLHNQYAVTVTDVNTGCRISSEKLNISEPAPLSIQLENSGAIRCFDGVDGSLEVSVSGGTLPYSYEWTDKKGQLISEEEDLLNIGSGSYQLLVTDANNCMLTFTDSLTVNKPPISLIDTSIVAVACFGESSGSINITPGGGKPPYQFLWNNGAITEDLENIPAGFYHLTLTDADTCRTIFSELEVPQNGALLEAETSTSPVSCFGAKDGAVGIEVSGGSPPYNFKWFWNGQPFVNANEPQLDQLPAGAYTLEFSDSQGCERVFEMEVESPSDIVAGIQVNIPQPPDYNDGGASVSVSGGQPPYDYLWSNGAITPSISDLPIGVYALTITDSKGCQDSISLTLTDYLDVNEVRLARLFPNPADGQFQLEVEFPNAIQSDLLILDQVGRPIFKKRLPLSKQHKFPIDSRNWPAGIYQVAMFYLGKNIFSKRLVIAR